MNIQVTFDPIEMLKNIDRGTLMAYIKNTLTDKEKEEIGDNVYTADSDTLWEALELKVEEERKDLTTFVESRMESSELLTKIDNGEILDYIKAHTQYYISEDVGELLEQIRASGCMDEVTELFEMKYTG